jgi:Methyltransferase domain
MEAVDGQGVPLPCMRHNLLALRELARLVAPAGLLVEVGAFAGESTRVFLEAGLRVHALDPWDNASRDRLHEGARGFDPDHRWPFDMAVVERRFDELLPRYRGRLTKRKGYDWQFLDEYPPGSVDAVYLDAVHTYADTRDAIRRWRPKVTPGGFLCGHDYAEYFPGVVQAVQEVLGTPHRVFPDTSWVVRVG